MSQSVADNDDISAGLTRRTVLAGAAATAAATVTATPPSNAQSVDPHPEPNDPNSHADMVLFVLLSAALTGIAEAKLAPGFKRVPALPPPSTTVTTPNAPPPPVDLKKTDPGSDPVNIKKDYFLWINDHRPAAFEDLLRLTKNSQTASNPAQTIIDKLQFDDTGRTRAVVESKYLARSIVLMWYLGAWYDPDDLEATAKDSNPERTANFIVISPKAYTQAWALRVAQAHPMGFSEMQFGYWHSDPNDISDFVGKKIS
jgi:hypothetical protein